MMHSFKVSFATVCSFFILLCGFVQAQNSSTAAVAVSPSIQSGESQSFPAKSAPGLYVNKSPAFSISYPKDWGEMKCIDPGCVFRAVAPKQLPAVRVFVIQTMGTPLESAAGIYSQELKKISGDVKLVSDRPTQLADGSPARETQIDWTYGGTKLRSGYLTTAKGGEWVVVVVYGNPEGRTQEEIDAVRKIAYSLKYKDEEQPGKAALPPYEYKIPKRTDDGWQTADAAQVKVNKKKLIDLIEKIHGQRYQNVHSVLVVKDGKLVFEEYFPGRDMSRGKVDFTRDELHSMMSVTKSFSSILIGIAIEKGMIKGTDEKLLTLFPDYRQKLSEQNKGEIALRDVLSMTAGFDWNEGVPNYLSPKNIARQMFAAEDKIGFILDRPVKDPPGQKFAYSTGLSTLLGTIIEKRSSQSMAEFAEINLLGPLGISVYRLDYLDEARKVPASGSGLFLRPRDMAKVGYLFLRKGNWQGKQIVSEKWVEESTRKQIAFPSSGLTSLIGYGYQWWLHKFEIEGKAVEGYAAMGYGGQAVYVFPAFDAVIVFTGGNYRTPGDMLTSMGMLKNHILPAIVKPE